MIKAIETQYKGYNFRSRLEARWAVFFEHSGITWEYEPEGLDVNGTWYLPDFRLEGVHWIEIKPYNYEPGQEIIHQINGSLICGDPTKHYVTTAIGKYIIYRDRKVDKCLWLHDQEVDSYVTWINGKFSSDKCPVPLGFVKDPATLAMSARFEHGQSGPTV